MSDSDSFIDEVTEEVRRDRLFALMRRYGWVAVLVVVLIVAGAAWREWRKAQEIAAARDFGDAVLSALEADDAAGRVAALDALTTDNAGGRAVVGLLAAAEQGEAGEDAQAAERLQAIAGDEAVPQVYRQIARYKALIRGWDTLPAETRRAGFETLAVPGQPLRLLAEEQLALIEIEAGAPAEAEARLQRIIADAEVSAGLRRRAAQLIVSLGGTPETGG